MTEPSPSGRDHQSVPISSQDHPQPRRLVGRRGFLGTLAGLVVGAPLAKRILPERLFYLNGEIFYGSIPLSFPLLRCNVHTVSRVLTEDLLREAAEGIYYEGRQWTPLK